ncbi:EAL domain-containing protein [Thiorhodococcus mannitoliphagus]|uniref:EAL domain-containing protein n=1 Tax=Thiorhodococcus mannitoliphagus TaxID=329406 RepID=A0A6P1DVA6_9GAMM|nr:EAL domain-containing protein [Thiorhodococcus mannitoliphagus]NEX19634.1 EAL domain-containing protein [Thiorhodococcus mannitoliphagus]
MSNDEFGLLLAHAGRLAQVGGWLLEPRTARFVPTLQWCDIHGLEQDDLTLDSLLRTVHPDDRAGMQAAFNKALEAGAPYLHQHRIIRPDDGRIRVIQDYGEVRYDAAGKAAWLLGAAQDVTERARMQDALRETEEHLYLALRLSGTAIWEWFTDSDLVMWSEEMAPIWGLPSGSSRGTLEQLDARVHPGDLPRWRESLRACVEDGVGHGLELRVVWPDGSIHWLATYGDAVRGEDGRATRLAGVARDNTELRQAEDEQARFFGLSLHLFLIAGLDGIIRRVNPAWTELLGYRQDELVAHHLLDHLHPEDVDSTRAEIQALLQGRDSHYFENRYRCKDGSLRTLAWSATAPADSGLIYAAAQDITERRVAEQALHESQRRLEAMAYYDHLTGLPNRRLLLDRLEQVIAVADREGSRLAVCYLDLDDFKPINDHCGHEVGDNLLRAVADRLVGSVRPNDTVARWGGDEFALLLTDLEGPSACAHILGRVLLSLGESRLIEGQPNPVSASIGATLYPEDHGDADSLLRHADHAMYLAKQCGRNNYQFFDPEKDREAIANRELLQSIGLAIDGGELRLLYQPIVNMRLGGVEALETLVRWQHPQRGLLAPIEFLPAIEGTDLMRRLDRWVLREALVQQAAWVALGLSLRLHINVSAHSLQGLDFLRQVSDLIACHPEVEPRSIELEILETAALDDLDQVSAVISDGARLGISFALDDFGTGYSSLIYLRRLPAGTLKIDQTFVRNMLQDREDCNIVEGVIGMARAFGRAVIAEGVETLEHGTLLMRLGCDRAQGYGIARPMAAAQLQDWVNAYRQPSLWADWIRGIRPE